MDDTSMNINTRQTGWCAALFTAFLWGSSPVVCMPLLSISNCITIVWLQYTLASLLLLAFFQFSSFSSESKNHPKLRLSWSNRHDIFWSAMCGFTGLGMFNYLSFRSLEWISASENGVIQGLLPILILLVGFLRHHARFSPPQILASCTAFVGVVLLIMQSKPGTIGFNHGHALSFASIICFASHAYARVNLANKYGAVQTMLHQLSFAALGFSVWVLFSGVGWQGIQLIVQTPYYCVSLLYLGIGITGLSYLIYLFSVYRIGVDNAGMALNAIPLSSFFLSYWLLGEPFSITRFIAIVVVISSMALFTRFQNPVQQYNSALP
jgi:drug/metabolite transporter (DMT)-like permease